MGANENIPPGKADTGNGSLERLGLALRATRALLEHAPPSQLLDRVFDARGWTTRE